MGDNVSELFGRDEPGRLNWSPPERGADRVVDAMRDQLYALILDNFGELVLSRFETRYGNIEGLRIGCLRYWSNRIRDKVEGEDDEERARIDSGEIEV